MGKKTILQQQVDKLRDDVQKVQASIKQIRTSGMKEKTVLVLLAHHTGLPQATIKKVMEGMETLEEAYFGDEE